MALTVFTDVFNKIDIAVMDIVAGNIGSLMNTLEPLLLSGFTVYLLFVFLSYWNGNLNDTLVDMFKRIMAWFVILGFSLNMSNYNEYIAPIVMGLGESLSVALSGDTSSSILDNMANNMVDIVVKNQDEANQLPITSVGRYIMIVLYNAIVIISFSVFLVIASSYILLAKVLTAILALIGPLFICLALFPATRQFFNLWVNQVINYSLLLLVMNILANFMVVIYGEIINFSDIEYPTSNTFLIEVVLLSFMFFVILLKTPDFVTGLSGGTSANGFSQAGRAIKNLTSPKQEKQKDKSDSLPENKMIKDKNA